ncbi:MAG: TetR/AcrR family transcriptional regulator [Prevotellaceae bacterium]|jgi:AcrR family transcriptional regulator|nr:TetR/AcrR family transcriptional regulator [Prevotellaceae bacterium]
MAKQLHTLDVKERILSVARELFIKDGYNSVSVRDIAAASDTNIAHINYYFQSKHHLFEIIFEDAFDILVKRVFAILRSDMPIFELIEAWINAYYELLAEYPQIPIFILNEINRNSEQLVEKIKNRIPKEIFYHLSSRLEEEYRKGTIKETSAVDLGLNIISLSVFPFTFGKFVMKISDISVAEYHAFLKQHKHYVIRFVLDALKP